MREVRSVSAPPLARVVTAHSLAWLAAANVVGVWLGLCLLWPSLGDAIAPFTYGRWTALHQEWQLYGWCSLPLVGALLAWCFDARHPHGTTHARIALAAWSLALALGGVAWLAGVNSGKLFLEWHGWARPLLPAAMHVLWALLAVHTVWRWRALPRSEQGVKVAVLLVLLVVPSLLYWSARRDVYPSVNPDSGGATGASLLGSTLGVVTIFLLLPPFLQLAPTRRRTPWAWALAASWIVFAAIDRGHASHHLPSQIVALGALLAWAWLLPMYWRAHSWPPGARRWLDAAGAWWVALIVSGWITFLPGISETLKFTHALVGHAHLAMAGLVTSVNAAILAALGGPEAPGRVFGFWQGGCVVFVIAMLALGLGEAERSAELFRSATWTQALLGLRLVGGAMMAAASGWWWSKAVRS